MFGNSHIDRIRESFADQFQPDGTDFVYRKYSKGAAIRVSVAEREAFVSTFNKTIRFRFWFIIPAVLLLAAGFVLFVPDVDSLPAQIGLYGGLSAIVAVFVGLYLHAWSAPSRALERRAVVARPLTRTEARHSALSKLSYGQLGALVVAGLVVVARRAMEEDLLEGWHILWLVLAAALIIIAGVQAFRKWRFERGR